MIRFRWIGIFLLLVASGAMGVGCKKSSTNATKTANNGRKQPPKLVLTQAGQTLLGFLPAKAKDVLYLPKLGQIPPQLDKFLERFEGTREGQLRRIVASWKEQFGINPLKFEGLKAAGFDANGALALARFHIGKRPTILLAISISNANAFKKTLQKIARQKLFVSEFKEAKHPKGSIFTAYGQNSFKQPVEEFSYTIHANQALIGIDLGRSNQLDPDAKPKHETFGQKVIEFALSLDNKNSLQGSTTFPQATLKGGGAQLLHFTENHQSDKQNVAGTLKKFSSRMGLQQLMRNPASLLKLRSQLPWRWSTTTLRINPDRIQFGSYLRLAKKARSLVSKLSNDEIKPKTMLHLLPKQTIGALKLSLKPKQLDNMFNSATEQLPLKARDIYAALKKYAGIDIPKDVLPNLTGQAYFVLVGFHPKIVARVSHHPTLLPGQLHAAIIAEIKDPQKALPVMEKLGNTLKFGRRGVKKDKQKDGTIQYSIPIPAWPGILAHWTIKGKYFIYSIGPEALSLVSKAIKDPKARLFTTNKANVLAAQNAGALYLNFDNLRSGIGTLDLSFTLRLLLANVLRMVRRVDALSISFGPTKQGLELQGEIGVK